MTVLAILLLALIVLFILAYLTVSLLAHQPRRELASETKFQNSRGEKDDLPVSCESESQIELTVLIPCYNEEKRLEAGLDDAVPVLEATFGDSWEVLIVDDASTDGTVEFVKNLWHKKGWNPDALRVCALEQNRGKGGAVAHGMRHFRGKYVIFADADGAASFKGVNDLIRAVTAAREANVKKPVVAVGSRAHMVSSEAVVKRSAIRNFLMHGLHTLVYVFGVKDVKDTQCGFKLFTRDAALEIFPRLHTERWIFDVEVLLIAEKLKHLVVEVPISWHEVSGSKIDLARDSIMMAVDLVVIRMAHIFGIYKI